MRSSWPNARDLYRHRSVWETLEENTALPTGHCEYALAIADAPSGFAVMALGRLGSREFDLLSDADVLFVADESTDREMLAGQQNGSWSSSPAYTRDGTVFPVDARLRPQGRAGELVTTPAQLAHTLSKRAQPWEAITYLRLRFLAGDGDVAEGAGVRSRGDSTFGTTTGIRRELTEMRSRLERVIRPRT